MLYVRSSRSAPAMKRRSGVTGCSVVVIDASALAGGRIGTTTRLHPRVVRPTHSRRRFEGSVDLAAILTSAPSGRSCRESYVGSLGGPARTCAAQTLDPFFVFARSRIRAPTPRLPFPASWAARSIARRSSRVSRTERSDFFAVPFGSGGRPRRGFFTSHSARTPRREDPPRSRPSSRCPPPSPGSREGSGGSGRNCGARSGARSPRRGSPASSRTRSSGA